MTIRVGILGLGAIGRTHARCIAEFGPALELIGYTSRRDAPSEIVGAARRMGAADLLREIDLAVVTTASDLHAEHAFAAITAGVGVVVEKPIATTADQARGLVAAWRTSGLFGAAIAQRRFEPQHQEIKTLLDSGVLGTPRLAEVSVCWWRSPDYYAESPWRKKAPGGGVLMNQALHSVDLLVWLLGPARSVTALTGNLAHDLACEDTSVVAVQTTSGAMACIIASTATPPGHPAMLRIHTSRGSFALRQSAVVEWNYPNVASPRGTPGVPGGAARPDAIGLEGHLAQWHDIVDSLTLGRPPAISLADGLDAVELVDASYRSAACRATVTLG